MASVYNAYVWKCERLEWTVKDIVASDKEQAGRRSMAALMSRPALRHNAELQQLKQSLYGFGECPPGITLQVVKVVDGPQAGPCVI